MTTMTREQALATLTRWLRVAQVSKPDEPNLLTDPRIKDPVWFFHNVLGADTYDKQEEILYSLRDNYQTSVAGCHGSGKDWTTGRAVLWWMTAFKPAKCIIIAPTFRQVAQIVWSETRTAYVNARAKLPGRLLASPRYDVDTNSYALGFSPDRPENIQGFHSPNLLVIISEAHAVDQADVDGLMRLQPTRVLMTGNTLVNSGHFYDSHHSKGHLWNKIAISAYDTPNVQQGKSAVPGMITQEWIDGRAADWGTASPLYLSAVYAEWPEDLEGGLVTLAVANRAANRVAEPGQPFILACDVARSGSNKTVIMRRRGNVADILWKVQGYDLMATAGKLYDLYRTERPTLLVVDGVGLGAGVVDRLRELRVPVFEYRGGEPAVNDESYVDRNAECWWLMRQWLLNDVSQIPNDPTLISQLVARKYNIQSDRRIRLERKEDLAARGVPSPDEADALAMTFVQSDKPMPIASVGSMTRQASAWLGRASGLAVR